MNGIRHQPNDRAAQLWAALRLRGEKGLSAKEAALAGLASEPYARRNLRMWAGAGYLEHFISENHRIGGDRYIMTGNAPLTVPVITNDGAVRTREPAMIASDFAALRRKSGLSLEKFGRALGREGHRTNVIAEMRKYETGRKPILDATAAKVRDLTKAP